MAAPRPLAAITTAALAPPTPPMPLPQDQADALASIFAFQGNAEYTPVSLPDAAPVLGDANMAHSAHSKTITPMSTGEITT